MLPVASTDLVFSVASGGEPDAPGGRGETGPEPGHEKTDSEDRLGNENTPDMGKRPLSTLNDSMPPPSDEVR